MSQFVFRPTIGASYGPMKVLEAKPGLFGDSLRVQAAYAGDAKR